MSQATIQKVSRYVTRAAVAMERLGYAMTSRTNRGGDAGGVLCGSAPRLYDSTDRVLFSV
jgi:hypothetical protein